MLQKILICVTYFLGLFFIIHFTITFSYQLQSKLKITILHLEMCELLVLNMYRYSKKSFKSSNRNISISSG